MKPVRAAAPRGVDAGLFDGLFRAAEASAMALVGHLDGLHTHLAEQQREIDDLREQVRQLKHQPMLDGQDDASSLEQAVAALRITLAEHERRLDVLSRDRTAQRLGAGEAKDQLTGGDYVVHQRIAGAFDALVNQELVDLAVRMLGEGATEYDEAWLRGALAAGYFDPPWADETVEEKFESLLARYPDLPQKALTDCAMTARRIRQDAAATGHRVRWVFDSYAATFDPVRQRLFEGCDGSAQIDFVVAPAYEVDGKIYAKQIVYTAAPEPAGRPAAAGQRIFDYEEAERQAATQPVPGDGRTG